MNLVMIICPPSRQADVERLLERHQVPGFTELPEVLGEGTHGKRLGTHAWPGKSSLLFTAVAPQKKDELVAALRELAASMYSGESLRAFILPVETAI